jgi:2-iminobutanoate/2-iminopropanoate deaminase
MRTYESALHPYSEVRFGLGGVAYVSGVLPYDLDGNIDRHIETAPQRILDVLDKRLSDSGLTLNNVVKTTVFVTDIEWRDAVNKAYRASFTSPMPARTIVEVRALPHDSPIEIEAVACRADDVLNATACPPIT